MNTIVRQISAGSKVNWWLLYFFTLFYIAVEFGFNYQLLELTVDLASEDILLGLEFWGRVISGVGLSLVLYRITGKLKIINGLRYFLCLIVGVALMWNVQKVLTDYLVQQASLEDKKISALLALLSYRAAEGSLITLSGNLVVSKPLSERDRKITASLFPALALYAPNRNEQLAAWFGKTPSQIQLMLAAKFSEDELSNAYRNLIIPPLTLGISIFFALLNLAQFVGMTVSIFQKRWRISSALIHSISVMTFIVFLSFSFVKNSPLADSRGYQEDFKESLYENDFFLAILTSTAARAVPSWYFFSNFSNQYILGGVQLKRPY